MVLTLATPPYQLLEVATVAKLHDYENFGRSLIDNSVVIFYDVSVTKFAQNIHLTHNLLLFFFAHYAVIKFFPNELLAITNSSYFLHFSKGP